MSYLRAAFILAAASWSVSAQVWDNTGNKLLNGNYYFREVTFTSNDAYAIYGTISFSSGTYNVNATAIQASTGSEGPYTDSGPYSISASGFGFFNNSLIGSPIYGLVGANGVFVGSITEGGVNDIFVAAPLTSQSAGTLQGAYSLSYADPTGALTGGTPFGALLTMNSNGGGGIGNVSVTAYSTDSTPTTQNISGVNYIVSNGAYVLTFPNSNTALLQGQEYLYSTPDGSFVFGGSPQGFDMIVGVQNGSAGTFGGLYYSAGLNIDNSQFASTGSVGLNSYYGSFNAQNEIVLAHQRILGSGGSAYSYTFSNSYPAGSGSYTDNFLNEQFIAGTGGTQIGVGIGPFPGVSVSVRAPSISGSGVFLSPQGIVNTASYSPFTAGVSRGDFIILEGKNLGPATLVGAPSVPFPTTLSNVKVLINNIAAPICYVSATQVAVIVPNEITTAVAQFQVINGDSSSNVVTEFVNDTTPGIFTQEENGYGYAAALHPDGSLVTPSSPAEIGETVAVFMSGLRDVFPTILDGTPAPSKPLSNTSNPITADISGTTATVAYAGLAPGYVGLYQVNIQIPSGVTTGDNFIDIAGPDSYNTEALISIGDSAAFKTPHVRTGARPHSKMRKPPVAHRTT